MSTSMYQLSIPVMTRMLVNLRHVLHKGEVYAREHDISEPELLDESLAPDMFNLKRQVQLASDFTRRGISRLAGMDIVSTEDNEKSFVELYARLDNTIDFLKSVKPEKIDNSESKSISFEAGGHHLHFDGRSMLLYFTLPNFYFHITTAYNILRHKGVPLGKLDYLGDPEQLL